MENKGNKLSLNKETIANLNNNSMELVNGGAPCSGGRLQCPVSEPATYCPGAPISDCATGCGTSCNNTACYTWCDCESIATGTCC